MDRFLLYAAVLWLAVRQRWHESKWNPWGIASNGNQVRAVRVYLDVMEQHGPAMLRTAMGRDRKEPDGPAHPDA